MPRRRTLAVPGPRPRAGRAFLERKKTRRGAMRRWGGGDATVNERARESPSWKGLANHVFSDGYLFSHAQYRDPSAGNIIAARNTRTKAAAISSKFFAA